MERIAIGAIMKQEAPYILEWVAYHRALGFELIIADNGGTDDTSKLLTALHNANIITRIDFRFKKTAPQIPAYRAILRLARKRGIEIVGFLDCDEFYTMNIPIQTISPASGAEHIASEFKRLNAVQISYNWLAYGSKTDCNDLSLPVLERFPYHAKFESESRSRSFKSFVLLRKVFRLSNLFLLGPQVFPHTILTGVKKDGTLMMN